MCIRDRGGVQPQSETVWRQAERYRVPRIAFVNKMDRVGADFFRVIGEISDKLAANPVALQIPLGKEDSFTGVIDLIEMHAVVYDDETKGAQFKTTPIPEEYRESAEEYRERLIEAVCDVDDQLMEAYLEGREIEKERIKLALKKGALSLKLTPVLCGTAFRNKGVQPLLDALVDYLPSPREVGAVNGKDESGQDQVRYPDDDESLSALAFKVMNDPYVGQLTFVRVYSGVVNAGETVYNSGTGKKERIGRLVRMYADKREEIKTIHAGEIAAVLGLKNTITGQTLCDPSRPIVLESMDFPEPVISIAIEPKTKADQEKLAMAMSRMSMEDPSFKVHTDRNTGDTLISGTVSSTHLTLPTIYSV